jgi:hypothetical protein
MGVVVTSWSACCEASSGHDDETDGGQQFFLTPSHIVSPEVVSADS